MIFCFFLPYKESGDDEYHEDHSDTEDEVDSDFDIDEGDEPDSAQEDDAPRRKSRVVTKAYKVDLWFSNILQKMYASRYYYHDSKKTWYVAGLTSSKTRLMFKKKSNLFDSGPGSTKRHVMLTTMF